PVLHRPVAHAGPGPVTCADDRIDPRSHDRSVREGPPMSSLECRDLTVRYGKRVAVDRFSAPVRSGVWLGIIGPNGAGKSSLLQAVVGIVASSGELLVDGAPLALRSRARRAALVAYVPQEPVMPADMSGFEYVLLGRAPYVGYFGTESRHD